jgi:5-methyltetrahydropteroyltriglutamate--homocysteine methyltransferase
VAVDSPAFNPRPEGILLIPGVIDVTTNYLEHPELVTGSIEQLVVGGDSRRVTARTDCGST